MRAEAAMIQGDEQHATGARRAVSYESHRAGAIARAPPIARRRFTVGDRVHRTLRGGVSRLRRLSLWLCAVDGGETLALRRAVFEPALSPDAGQYRSFRRPRREREDVPGPAVVGLLLAPPMVDQGVAGALYVALADRDGTGLRLISLDADRPARPARRPVIRATRDRRPVVAQQSRARARLGHRRLYLEMDAVLDGDLYRRPDDDPARPL